MMIIFVPLQYNNNNSNKNNNKKNILIMIRHWYIKFSDSVKAEKVSYHDYRIISDMARFYNAVVSSNFHPHGKTLVVSFTKHFV